MEGSRAGGLARGGGDEAGDRQVGERCGMVQSSFLIYMQKVKQNAAALLHGLRVISKIMPPSWVVQLNELG